MGQIYKALNYHLRGKEVSSIKNEMCTLTIIFNDGTDLTVTATRDAELSISVDGVMDYDLKVSNKER